MQDKPFFFPFISKEFNGKKFHYCGQFQYNKKLIRDLKYTMFKNGFSVEIQPYENQFILWSRKK